MNNLKRELEKKQPSEREGGRVAKKRKKDGVLVGVCTEQQTLNSDSPHLVLYRDSLDENNCIKLETGI